MEKDRALILQEGKIWVLTRNKITNRYAHFLFVIVDSQSRLRMKPCRRKRQA